MDWPTLISAGRLQALVAPEQAPFRRDLQGRLPITDGTTEPLPA